MMAEEASDDSMIQTITQKMKILFLIAFQNTDTKYSQLVYKVSNIYSINKNSKNVFV